MKLIMTYMYIRSTMTKSRLMNLAILSTERETIELVDFTEVIENFAYAVYVICYMLFIYYRLLCTRFISFCLSFGFV